MYILCALLDSQCHKSSHSSHSFLSLRKLSFNYTLRLRDLTFFFFYSSSSPSVIHPNTPRGAAEPAARDIH